MIRKSTEQRENQILIRLYNLIIHYLYSQVIDQRGTIRVDTSYKFDILS